MYAFALLGCGEGISCCKGVQKGGKEAGRSASCDRMTSQWKRMAVVLLALFVSPSDTPLGGQTPQRTAEQTAFAQARAITEPEARVAALQGIAVAYPGSGLAKRSAALELETLLRAFPDRTGAIHALAAAQVAATPAGVERWSEEARLADLLASAGLAGADLADAQAWAEQAVRAMTEEAYRRGMRGAETRYHLPPLSGRELHREFLRTRASFLAALANVDLRGGRTDAAVRALTEAERLDPLMSEVSCLRGQIALAEHRDGAALEALERAEAEGDLKEPWRGEMVRLYRLQHPASAVEGSPLPVATEGPTPTGLNDEIDSLYAKLFPPPFALAPRRLPPGGHTVLLELFTGSGCAPCAAPDLAVESLLGTYGREDLVVLEYDEHIPRPDPLTSPASVNRAAAYGVGTTPEAFLDGEELPVAGASRGDAENVVVGFANAIESEAAVPSGVRLQLTVRRLPNGTLDAAAVTAFAEGAGRAAAAPVLRFALVEDHVRYSGENGIRFHRMVVRAIAQGHDLVSTGAPAPVHAMFDPVQVAEGQRQYLAAFETGNDRFGAMEFRTREIPIDPGHLAVAAWWEDPRTHQVLQTAFAPVPSP